MEHGKTVIDVGANIGALTVPMSKMVGDTGRIYAIESHPPTFNVLCANLALNGIQNVKPMNAFVAMHADANPDEAAFFGAKSWSCSYLSLDSLDLESLHFLKIDVDGSELEVFRSGEMQIERFRPILYFENEIREKSTELLKFVMRSVGYDAYFHPAVLFEPNNFFGNTVNHWAPSELVSMMVLAVPAERKLNIGLKRIANSDDWWDFGIPVSSYFAS